MFSFNREVRLNIHNIGGGAMIVSLLAVVGLFVCLLVCLFFSFFVTSAR